MFIYHSVLEELHQGCINNDKIIKQEEKLRRQQQSNQLVKSKSLTFKEGLKSTDRELTK